MAPKRKKKGGMSKEEALTRIKDIEDPLFAEHMETYNLAVRGMQDNMADREIIKKGQWALALGAITHPRYLISAGAVEVVLAAMKRYVLDDRLQADGCEALRLLCTKRDGMRRALEQDGIQAVCNALANHPESERVQMEACGALSRFSEKDTKAVLEKGGYENILFAMNMFPDYSWVHMQGCVATTNFSKLSQKKVEDATGYETVKASMKHFSGEVEDSNIKPSEAVGFFGRETLSTRPVVMPTASS